MIRKPAVAGQFYPADAGQAWAWIEQLWPREPCQPSTAKAVIMPHAGWMYSGATAAIAASHVTVPDCVILLGPNHHNLGHPYAVFARGTWQLPVGDVAVDEATADELLTRCDLLRDDAWAHSREHSLEVEVPFLMRTNPRLQIVPIVIGGPWPDSGDRARLRTIARAVAETVAHRGQPVLLVASTDFNHYEDQRTTERKDRLALEAIEHRDPELLMDRVQKHDISMCGVAPTYIALHAANQLGAQTVRILDHRTSGDVSGDYHAVVGYAAAVIQ
ncbi:MAG: AmmeMemoRadiSam system protein B [Verrucomicrobiae bacterium]|nr:AmmeMemoRadiSam system protein B [Verrucomicrobiae bacterium]